MKVAFVHNFWEELPSLCLLSEVLRERGHDVRLFLNRRGWLEDLSRWQPRVAAFSATTGSHHQLLSAAAAVKKIPRPPVIVMGGPHPTFCPEVIEHPALDAICRGEGEISFPEFLSRLTPDALPEDVPGFWVKKEGAVIQNEPGPLVADLDTLPIPTRFIYGNYPFIRDAALKRVMASRGCPYSCTYCYNHAYRKMMRGKGPYLRRRSVGHVMEELLHMKRNVPFTHIDFLDDVFTLDKEWVLSFCEEYAKKLGASFSCLNLVTHMDDDICRALSRAGCTRVYIGVESGSQRVRRDLMGRSVSDQDIFRCAALVKKHGMTIQTFNMLGLPGETMEEAMQTVEINRKLRPDYAWSSIATPYPGTRLAEMCKKAGALPKGSDPAIEIRSSYYSRSVLSTPEAKKLENLQKFFWPMVRFPRLTPLFHALSRLPPNALFRVFGSLHAGVNFKKRAAGVSWLTLLRLYMKNKNSY
ncbi:MAG: radical SAM protein [Thermodesulfobacteriota bacterium]